MITLEELQKEYGYTLLTNDEVRKIREDPNFNWNSLEGEIIIRKCLKSYPAYLQAVNYGYTMTAYHYSLAANLQRDYEKPNNIDPANGARLNYGLILLSAPPQTGKSLTVTESFQSWAMIKNPRLNVLTIGYEATFTARFGRRNRDKFGEFAPILSHNKVKLHDKVQSTETWETMVFNAVNKMWQSANGVMYTAGMGGALTGKTSNLCVVDDPIKNMKDAESESKITDNIDYFESAIETRALANPGSKIIVMCTRWVPNDLIGWLKRHRKKYIIGDYNYAALSTEQNALKDPLKREVGEGICPEMGLDANWAYSTKESYTASSGGHVFNSMFQGEPSDEQGNLYKEENWEEYDINKIWIPEKLDKIYLSIDATFKDKIENDYVAMGVGAIHNGNNYLRYIVRKHLDFPATLDKIIYLLKKFPEIETIYIEDKANGPAIIQVLRKWRNKLNIDIHDFPSVYPLEAVGSKYSRAQSASVYQRDGRCYIPIESQADMFSSPDDFEWDGELSYTNAFKYELGTFPYGANDDMVDMFAQAINANIGLLSGVEKVEKKEIRFSRYSTWDDLLWHDFKQLKTQDEKNLFIKIHGAPKEWSRKGGING